MTPNIEVSNLSETCVRLTCLLEAPQERVYRAWTTPAEMARWFTPEGATCEAVETDARVGGRYRLDMVLPDGHHVTTGEYTALEPHRLIRFTWLGTCGTPEDVASEVTVELSPAEGKTRLTLTHERLANALSRDRHAAGWVGCLTGLTRYITGERSE